MKLGLILFKYFPYGGLQRDMLRIAQLCAEQAEVHIFTLSWQGDRPEALNIHILPSFKLSNHRRYAHFYQSYRQLSAHIGIDRCLGFNKLPELDFYYAADPCLAAKMQERPAWLRYLPRYRFFLKMERSIFARGQNSFIFYLSHWQQTHYQKHYATEKARSLVLPPSVDFSRQAKAELIEQGQALRAAQGIAEQDKLILCLGSGFKTKGLDRALIALAHLPPDLRSHCHLWVVGRDRSQPFQRLAKYLGIHQQVRFLGGRSDVPVLLQAADLLLHPARYESAGMVLLEAVIAGLPVLTTASCGYAEYVQQAQAGRVLPLPFEQKALNQALTDMLLSEQQPIWRQNGIHYGQSQALNQLHRTVVEHILA